MSAASYGFVCGRCTHEEYVNDIHGNRVAKKLCGTCDFHLDRLREQYFGMAMQAIISSSKSHDYDEASVANMAMLMADAMIDKRNE